MSKRTFIAELKRRNVIRMAGLYLVGAWLVTQVADTVLPMFGAPGWLPRSIVILLAIGLLPALVFAWVFEFTPDGIKRDAEVDPAESIAPHTAQRMNRTIFAVLLIALTYFGVDKFVLAPQREVALQVAAEKHGAARIAKQNDAKADAAIPEVNQKSIAVLPFANLSPDPANQYIADGLSEEILNSLTRTPDLQVAARTSSFSFKGGSETIPAIAAKLGVAHVLEGSVRRSGDRIRVTAQLIRAEDGFQLWSENYDRANTDIIAIQEDVALEIAKALKTAMDPEALASMQRAGTRSVPAYEAYLGGLGLHQQALETGEYSLAVDALVAFDRATTIDPAFADAYARAADLMSAQLQPTSMAPSQKYASSYAERMQRYRAVLDAAIRHSRTDQERFKYRASRAAADLRFIDALGFIREYLAGDPHDREALDALADWSLYAGDPASVRAAAEALLALHPSGRPKNEPMVWMLRAGDGPRAAELARQALRQRPGNIDVTYQAHRVLLSVGAVEEAAWLVPALLASPLDSDLNRIIQVRQACAEGRVQDALAIPLPGEISSAWHVLKTQGRDREADRLLDPLDTPATLYALSGWLTYPHFDARRYPKLQAVLAAQGIKRPLPHRESYACPPIAATL